MDGTRNLPTKPAEPRWAKIPRNPGYLVSDLGQVMSPSGRVLKPQPNGKYGYLGVNLGRGPRFYVHRLVAEAFLGCGEALDVDHINGDTSDNRLCNLRYMTHAQNMAAQRERKPNCHKGHPFADAYWDPRGRRQCRTCRAQADLRRRRQSPKNFVPN